MQPGTYRLHCLTAVGLLVGTSWAQNTGDAIAATPTFGVTVVAPFGFCGRIYEIPEEPVETAFKSAKLPKFEKLQPVGTVYTTILNVPPRPFEDGFPGVTARFEWFAIDYNARFWIETPGKYSFRLLSDDGSALYIDEKKVIDNDHLHPPRRVRGSVQLSGGLHDMRVSYFQGPRFYVALVLDVKPPRGEWRVFSTQEFRPPADPSDWRFTNSANLDVAVDPCKLERHLKTLLARP
jgi:hypothetical protein